MKEKTGNILMYIILLIIVFLVILGLYEFVFKNTKYYTVVDGEITKAQINNKKNSS